VPTFKRPSLPENQSIQTFSQLSPTVRCAGSNVPVAAYTGPVVFNNNGTRMWANAQRDGHPAEYRWRPLFNAVKFGRRPLLRCRALTLPRRETR